jgi:hypothetical protein
MSLSKKDTKKIKEVIKEYDPLKNKVKLEDGSQLKWKIKPNISSPEKTKVNLEWQKQFKDDDVEISIKVNGKPFKLISEPGNPDFEVQFKASKRF